MGTRFLAKSFRNKGKKQLEDGMIEAIPSPPGMVDCTISSFIIGQK
jgi:hypothetical protein